MNIIKIDGVHGPEYFQFDSIKSVVRQPDGMGGVQARVQCGPSHMIFTGDHAEQFMKQYQRILKEGR